MTLALITGGSGFVGGHLSKLLADEGIAVANFDLVEGRDIRDYEAIRLAVDHWQPSLVFHLCAQAYVPESTYNVRRGIETNVLGLVNLLNAIRDTGSSARIMVAGSSEEYGYDAQEITEDTPTNPTTPYGVAKLAATGLAQFYAEHFGLNCVVTRAFNHTGPGHPAVYAVPSFAKRVAEVEAGISKAVAHGNLASVRNYSDVRDIVRAYRLAIDLPSGVYNICSENTVTMQYVLDTLRDLAEGDIPTEPMAHLHRQTTSRFPAVSCDLFKSKTGWEPQIDFRTTLQDVLDYYRGLV